MSDPSNKGTLFLLDIFLYLYNIRCISFMCSLYRNKYLIESARYPNYDYTSPGKYFITICTKNQIPYFGKILNGRMILSQTGIIVNDFWLEIPSHYTHITLDEFIIMPDHIHGILIINRNSVQAPKLGASVESNSDPVSGKGNKYWNPNSIGSIINQFKRICTITAKTKGFDLIWHPRFYDRIIRSTQELDSIRKYIKNNPVNWHKR